MAGLAIALFLMGAALLFFAFRPKLAFFLDEGWKFKGDTEPSDVYVGVNLVGRVFAGVFAIAMGFVLLGQSADVDARDAALHASDRCHDELLPKFDHAIAWRGSRVADPGRLRSLATELGVEVSIEDDPPAFAGAPSGDLIQVLDANRPGQDKVAFRYRGAYHDQYWAAPHVCASYLTGIET